MLWRRSELALVLLGLATAGGASPVVDPSTGRLRQLQAVRFTSAVEGDADDCAVWVHPTDPARSLLIGTDKAKGQGIHVWDLQGQPMQFVRLGRPNNIDVRQGVRLGKERLDVAVATVRGERGLRVFRIERDRKDGPLTDITVQGGIPTPELDDPYGICLYVRKSDSALFAFASTAAGDRGHLHQYRLEADATGRIRGTHVRALGQGAILDKIEGLVADDGLGLVYAGDEKHAVLEFAADPDAKKDAPLSTFALDDGITGDREGIGLYRCPKGLTYLLLSSQANHSLKVYRRDDAAKTAARWTLVVTYATPDARQTDGLDVTSSPLGAEFPTGLLVKHDSPGRRFALYAWPPEPRVGCEDPEGGWPDHPNP
jgi:3-phytase